MAELVIKLVNGELAGKTMQELQKNTTAAALAVKKAEIGTQAWVEAHKKLEGAKQLQADLKKQIDSTSAASDQLKQAWSKLPGAQYFNQVVSSFSMMKQGVGGLVSQFGVLKTAIAATGIGALVIAFTTLVAWFQKTDEGAMLLSGILKGLGIVMDKVFGGMIDLVKSLSEYFTGKKSIKQGLIDLVEFIGNNLLNRVKAFGVAFDAVGKLIRGDFSGGLKQLGDSVIQFNLGITDGTDKMMKFGESIADAVQEGIDFEKQLDAIQDKARELSVLNAETEKNVSQLLLQSKNVGLTYKERIELLDKASALELKNHTEQLANAKALEALRQKEIDDNKARNIQTDELDQALADAQIARINLDKESITLQEKIANRRTALIEKQVAEEQKAAEEELKIQKNLIQLRGEAMQESLDKDIELIKISTQEKINALNGSASQIAEQQVLLTQIEAQQIQAVKDKYAEEAKAKEEKAIADKQKRDKEAADKELADIQQYADHKNFLLLESLSQGQITRQQFDELAQQNQVAAWEEQLVALEQQGLKESALYEQTAAKIIDIELAKQDKIKAAREQTFKAAVAFGNAFLQSQIDNINRENAAGDKRLADIEARNGKESDQYKTAQAKLLSEQHKNFEKKKKLEKSQIRINALAEIAGIIKGAVEVGGLYGVVIGAILSAATLVRANSAIKQVDAQQFADGGFVTGPSHAQGGIPGVVRGSRRPVEFEGGEFFFSKKAVQAIGVNNLTRLNDHYTQKFAGGGPVNPFEDRTPIGGSVNTNKTQNSIGGGDQITRLEQSFNAYAARVDQWARTLKVNNVVTETETGIKTVNKIRDDANV